MFSNNEVTEKKQPQLKQHKEEILALWERTDRNGDKYYVGKLKDGAHVLAFHNKDKKTNIPAIRVYKTDKQQKKSVI